MQSIMEGPHEILYGNTNKSEMLSRRSDCWSHWRYVLNGLMHLQGVQEGAGIQSCIRNVLRSCAEFESVSEKTNYYLKITLVFVVILLFRDRLYCLGTNL